MRKQKQWWVLFGVLIALLAGAVWGNAYVGAHTQLLSDAGVKTGLQNRVLAHDEASGLLLVGTYNNKLIAFREGEPVWEFEAKGPFRKLIVREDGTVYAGNEDNHVYMLSIEDGALIGDINVQRRIYDVDVAPDGERILISAGTTAAKHNLMIYTPAGEQLFNRQYRTTIKGARFATDGNSIVAVNNRGELVRMDLEGEELNKVKLSYEQVGLVTLGAGRYLSMGIEGTYQIFDEDLNVLRGGRPPVPGGDEATAIGADASGEFVFVGTKERFVYAMNAQDQVIYQDRLGNSITSFLPLGDTVLITGLGDFVSSLNVADLSNIALLTTLKAALNLAVPILAVLAAFCLLMAVPGSHKALVKLAKALYKHKTAYILLIPTFVLLILFNYTPVFMAFTRAFTNWSKTNYDWSQISFVGLDNFRLMLTENYFLRGLSNLLLLLVTGFAKVLTVPLIVAWMVSMMKSDRQKYIYRFLLVLPIVVPSVVSALLWKQIYDPQIGLINQLLGKLGLQSLQRVWLGNETTAIWAIIFMGFPFVDALAFLVYYGGFTNIDGSIYESARVDGASRSRIFWRIQLPMIFPQIKLIIILRFIGVVQDFAPIYLLTGGGPGTSTYVPGLELYYNATTFGRYGYACALGIVMFVFIMIGTLLNMRLKAQNNQ